MGTDKNASADVLHEMLIDGLVEQKLIVSPSVEAAFRAVRRAFFLPDRDAEEVYSDQAIPTKLNESGRPISSSSQPAIMAIMLEQLELQPGHNVLEIGAGTGYNAALMAHIVGEAGHVTTLDIDADLVESARAHLEAAGFEQVEVICGDGMLGYAENAPYDRIILTVAGWEIPPEWLAQLQPDGRLLLPLSFYGPQLSIAFERQDGHLASHSIKGCGFMPLRGARAEPLRKVQIDSRPDLTLIVPPTARSTIADGDTLAAWLRSPFVEAETGIEVKGGEIMFTWSFWAALHEPEHVLLEAAEEAVEEGLLPFLVGEGGPSPWQVSMGLLTEAGLALLSAPADEQPAEGDSPFARSFPLHIRGYGPDKSLATRLLQALQAWDEAGRPWITGMTVVALPLEETAPSADDLCLTRRWHHFCFRWESG